MEQGLRGAFVLGLPALVLLALLARHFAQHGKPLLGKDPSSTRGLGFQFEYDDWCDTLVNAGGWVGLPYVECDSATSSVATCGPGHTNNWQWGPEATRCGAHRLARPAAAELLADKWVLVAGDSIGRFFFAALLRLLNPEGTEQVVYGHRDFEYQLPHNTRATFLWAPYLPNITARMQEWTRAREAPGLVVLSAGLWHMLHIHDVADFQRGLAAAKLAAQALLARSAQAPTVSLMSLSEVYPPKLKTEEKRAWMTPARVDLYNRGIALGGVLVPTGPFQLLDIHRLTQGCGPPCTHDGLHYSNATYDAAVQIWGNTIRAQSPR